MTGHKAGLQRRTACCCLLVGLNPISPAKCSSSLLLQRSGSLYLLLYKTDAIKPAETGGHINSSLQGSTCPCCPSNFSNQTSTGGTVFSPSRASLQPSLGPLACLGGEERCSIHRNHPLSAHNRRGLLFGWGRLFPPTSHHMASRESQEQHLPAGSTA